MCNFFNQKSKVYQHALWMLAWQSFFWKIWTVFKSLFVFLLRFNKLQFVIPKCHSNLNSNTTCCGSLPVQLKFNSWIEREPVLQFEFCTTLEKNLWTFIYRWLWAWLKKKKKKMYHSFCHWINIELAALFKTLPKLPPEQPKDWKGHSNKEDPKTLTIRE